MPKLKTRKSTSKRIKISKTGKALRSRAGRRHLLSSKTTSKKRNMRTKKVVQAGKKLFKVTMPYDA